MILTAYYSRAGENYYEGSIKSVPVGNTERLVEMLERMVETMTFRIEMEEPYSDNYQLALQQAEKDLKSNARPALKNRLFDIDEYDTVILCFPSFYGTIPAPVRTFCSELYWNGKYVLPICTNEGSGMGSSVADLTKLCPGATISRGLSISGSHIEEARGELEHWLFLHGVK